MEESVWKENVEWVHGKQRRVMVKVDDTSDSTAACTTSRPTSTS